MGYHYFQPHLVLWVFPPVCEFLPWEQEMSGTLAEKWECHLWSWFCEWPCLSYHSHAHADWKLQKGKLTLFLTHTGQFSTREIWQDRRFGYRHWVKPTSILTLFTPLSITEQSSCSRSEIEWKVPIWVLLCREMSSDEGLTTLRKNEPLSGLVKVLANPTAESSG